jgi:beta-N-acetylhexosaminidase
MTNRGFRGRLLLAITLICSFTFSAVPSQAIILKEPVPDYSNPRTWTDEALAAQTIFVCSSAGSLKYKLTDVRKGLGGIALVGTGATPNIRAQIRYIKSKALRGITPVIASDEEGGDVQRLRRAIYTLPSAATMGTWSDAKLRKTAFAYGKRMKSLGVDIAFSPVADLSINGFFIDRSRRSFGLKPSVVSRKVVAWADGLKDADVLPVVKHWPGHGHAADTHAVPGRVPALSKLIDSDLVPFNYAFERGVTAVMVGHLLVPGLTEPNTPTSRSRLALDLLRTQIGPEGLIITDSLSMGGATKGVRGNISEAAIRSLEAGVDVALVCTGPKNLIAKVTAAVTSGRLPREQMISKVERILAYKRQLGVIP